MILKGVFFLFSKKKKNLEGIFEIYTLLTWQHNIPVQLLGKKIGK